MYITYGLSYLKFELVKCIWNGYPIFFIFIIQGGYMPKGEIKWFNNTKGWGFIMPESGTDDIFVHFSSINGSGYKTLLAGQQVEYELQNGDRGPHASNVTALARYQAETSDEQA